MIRVKAAVFAEYEVVLLHLILVARCLLDGLPSHRLLHPGANTWREWIPVLRLRSRPAGLKFLLLVQPTGRRRLSECQRWLALRMSREDCGMGSLIDAGGVFPVSRWMRLSGRNAPQSNWRQNLVK